MKKEPDAKEVDNKQGTGSLKYKNGLPPINGDESTSVRDVSKIPPPETTPRQP